MADSTTLLDEISAGQADKEGQANELFDAGSPGVLYGRRASTSAGLTWGYYGGILNISGTLTAIANGIVALTASTTNYIEAEPSTGAVSKNTTAFTAGRIPLYAIVTGTDTVTSWTDKRGWLPAAARGAAYGVASLDSGGKVPTGELPASITGAMNYQGAWNANTNSPALASGSGTKGHYYTVSVAGTTTLDGISSWSVGDKAAYNGTAWEKFEGALTSGEVTAALGFTPLDAATVASETVAGKVELLTAAETATGTDNTRAVHAAGGKATYRFMGKETIGVPAGALRPTTTGGCASAAVAETGTNKINYVYLAFDAATVEKAFFWFPSPKSHNASTMTFRVVWTHPATTTNFGTAWKLRMLALSNDDAIDTACGTAVQVNDTGGTTQDFYTSDESAAVTPGNTMAKQDWIYAEIERTATDGTNDTLAVDAHLIGVDVYYWTDANNDA